MTIMAVFDAIINFKKRSNLEFFATQYGSLKSSFVMYIILACISLVLAEIFEKATAIKNENDLAV